MGTKKAVRSFASCISITAILFGIVGDWCFPKVHMLHRLIAQGHFICRATLVTERARNCIK